MRRELQGMTTINQNEGQRAPSKVIHRPTMKGEYKDPENTIKKSQKTRHVNTLNDFINTGRDNVA